MVNLIEQFKKEWQETFKEQQDSATRTRVFSIMGDLADIDAEIKAIDLQKELLVEQKEKLETEFAALGSN